VGEEAGDPQIQNLEFDLDGRIAGFLCITTKCSTCGVFETKLDAQLDLLVPLAHRDSRHELEIDFESVGSGEVAGFPVKVCCSCGGLEAKGVLILRRGN
jgi:hypothetical protein